MLHSRKPANPFRYFRSSPEVIRLVVMMYVRFPLSLRNVEDLLFERGIDICHETVRLWWNRFGPMFAADIRRQRVSRMESIRSVVRLTHQSCSASLRGHSSDFSRRNTPFR
jgi:putative transposase